jgi:Lrp/AsnC family transcriptional regulator, leucine-responsive regulatory protein
MLKIDEKDRKLILELEKNSRESISTLAKNIGVSKEVANYRLKRLTDTGMIKGFRILIDHFSLGYHYYRLLINLSNFKKDTREAIIKYLKENKIEHRIFLQSTWDLEITVPTKDPQEFYSIYDEFISKYSIYINRKDFAMIKRISHFNHCHLHNHHGISTIEGTSKITIDETDAKIIDVLNQNPRIETVKISKALGISVSSTAYKIKNLIQKNIIKGFKPILDTSILGYNKYKVIIRLSQPAKTKHLCAYLSQIPNVINVMELIGRDDVDVEVDFKNSLDLDGFLERIRVDLDYVIDFEVIMCI